MNAPLSTEAAKLLRQATRQPRSVVVSLMCHFWGRELYELGAAAAAVPLGGMPTGDDLLPALAAGVPPEALAVLAKRRGWVRSDGAALTTDDLVQLLHGRGLITPASTPGLAAAALARWKEVG